MSYNPTQWQNGDTITAQKMNKLENGVAENGYIVLYSGSVYIPTDIPAASEGYYWEYSSDYSTGGLYKDAELTQKLTFAEFQSIKKPVVVLDEYGVPYYPVRLNFDVSIDEPPVEGNYITCFFTLPLDSGSSADFGFAIVVFEEP